MQNFQRLLFFFFFDFAFLVRIARSHFDQEGCLKVHNICVCAVPQCSDFKVFLFLADSRTSCMCNPSVVGPQVSQRGNSRLSTDRAKGPTSLIFQSAPFGVMFPS